MKHAILFLFLTLMACSRSLEQLQPKAEIAVNRWACGDFQSALFDVVYVALIDLKTIPTKTEFVQLFESILLEKKSNIHREEFLKTVEEFYETIISQSHEGVDSMLQKVAAAELGSQENEEAQKVQRDLNIIKQRWSEIVIQNQGQCDSATAQTKTLSLKTHASTGFAKNPVSYGAEKILAVAYQSCEALRRPAMVSETPVTEGIAIVGTAPDGVGKKRVIRDLPALLRSNYYLQDFDSSTQCKDIRQSPLIYDYGGKPSTPTSRNILDVFTNAGNGTGVLGVDCSGYVFSAIATAGLKLDPNRKLKPVLVHGINAVLYKEPEQNGMPCLTKIAVGIEGTLRAGDIVAKTGHVLIIDSVGVDPLGIKKALTIEQCNQITSSSFDFIVAQSSPSKNGIGINKFVGKDYLGESPTMKVGLEKYARTACKAKLKGENILLSGQDIQVVRHKLTAECMDDPIPLVGEACVAGCTAL